MAQGIFYTLCKKVTVLAKSHIIITKTASKKLYQSHYVVWKKWLISWP